MRIREKTSDAQNNCRRDEDFDFIGDFSSKKSDTNISETNINRPRPSEIALLDEEDNLSVLSKSTDGTVTSARRQFLEKIENQASFAQSTSTKSRQSPLYDPKFSPPPLPPLKLAVTKSSLANQQVGSSISPLPVFDHIQHSGIILARFSFTSLVMKRWREKFWISYGDTAVLFFKSREDFYYWASNPYLTQKQRDSLVDFKVDFIKDLYKVDVRGYQVTKVRAKTYRNRLLLQLLNQFKLEKWMDYGPCISGAFASIEEKHVQELRTIFTEMMKKSPQNVKLVRRVPRNDSLKSLQHSNSDLIFDSSRSRYGVGVDKISRVNKFEYDTDQNETATGQKDMDDVKSSSEWIRDSESLCSKRSKKSHYSARSASSGYSLHSKSATSAGLLC